MTKTIAGRALLSAYAATAVICAFVPLADHIGNEFATALTIIAAIFAPAVGFAAIRLESRLAPELQRPARAAATAGLFAVCALLLPTAIILLNAFRRPICDPVAGSIWLLLLPAPTAWLSVTLGALSRSMFRWTPVAIAAVVIIEIGSAFTTFLFAYFGPAAFGYDHFGGYFEGIARGEIPITAPLLSFRAATIAWGAAIVTAIGALWTVDPAVRRMHRSWAIALTLALSIISLGWADDLGWRTTDASLRRAIAGEQRVGHVIVHYARTSSDIYVDALMRDAAYTESEVRRVLGITPVHPVHVWVYPSTFLKSRLVGNGGTNFAQPWRHAVHIVGGGFPLPSLRHELLHAFAAEFAPGPWGIAGGLIPNVALIEGFADAYDIDDGSLTAFQDAKAMRDLGIAPDLVKMMSITGFGNQSTSRAYGYSAAFVRYLDNRFGTAAVRQLYETEDFAPMGGVMSAIRGFEQMLDTVRSDAAARSTTARRHSELAITKRTCAREVYALTDSAFALAANRLWDASLQMYDKACALQPENPELLWQKMNVTVRMRPPTIAPIREVADALLKHPRTDPTLAALTHQQLADYFLRLNDVAGARRELGAAAELPSGPETKRGIATRRLSLDDSVRLNAVKLYFALDGTPGANTYRMMDAERVHPNEPILLYLLGRQLQLGAFYDNSIRLLERAARVGLPDPDLARETDRMLVIAYASRIRCDDAQRTLDHLASIGGARADRVASEDWISRCRFGAAKGWKQL